MFYLRPFFLYIKMKYRFVMAMNKIHKGIFLAVSILEEFQ